MLQELVETLPSDMDVYVMYGVACNLVRHLKASVDGQYLLESLKFAIPAFHAYGHNAPCQVSEFVVKVKVQWSQNREVDCNKSIITKLY